MLNKNKYLLFSCTNFDFLSTLESLSHNTKPNEANLVEYTAEVSVESGKLTPKFIERVSPSLPVSHLLCQVSGKLKPIPELRAVSVSAAIS